MTNDQLIFLLIPETKWGHYIIHASRAVDRGEFYTVEGIYTNELPTTPHEKKILSLCRQCEQGNLYRLYGRKKYKNEKEFAAKVDEELLKHIRGYVDKTVVHTLRLIEQSNHFLFLKESRLENPYKKDRVNLFPYPLKLSLGFYRNEEHIRYVLQLITDKERLSPCDTSLRIITMQPGVVLFNNTLFALPEDTNAIRLKPFLTKKEVIIPRRSEQEYFRRFILKNMGNEDIEAEGFEIIETDNLRNAILSVEKSISGHPIIELNYRYGNRIISSRSSKQATVELKEEHGEYRFYRTMRAADWEEKVVELLLGMGLEYTATGALRLPETTGIYPLIEWINLHLNELRANHIEVSQQYINVKFYTGKWKVEYNSKQTAIDWFQLHATITLEDGEQIPLHALWRNILSGEREYLLPDGRIFLIPEEWFSRYAGIMLFGDKQKEHIVFKRNQSGLLKELNFDIEKEERLSASTPTPPRGLKATLRYYQQLGFEWLYALHHQQMGACLADDMGLGKTIQTIAMILKYKEESMHSPAPHPGKPIQLQLALFPEEETTATTYCTCLVVTPASIVYNWRNEFLKFAPSLSVLEYVGTIRNRQNLPLMNYDVVITTYQTLRNDIHLLREREFGITVFDEAQSFKNRDSQVYHAVSQINSKHYIALSGTPIENSLSDLWSLMSIINPGLMGSHTTFQEYYIKPITADITGRHTELLRKLIAPFILRRTKEEVLDDLPERTNELIICEADPEQKSVYDEELSKARNHILEESITMSGNGNKTINSLTAIMRLRQIANHPKLADPEYAFDSGKVKEVFRMLEDIYGTRHKVLLFSDYVSYLELIGEQMQERGWEYATLTGSTRNREEVIEQFSTNPNCHFFLISLKAGGVGLNLTEADYVFILDPWWNLAAEEQAISRAHRMGQKHAVFVYRFVTAGTLEEKILKVQQKKQDLSKAIISTKEDSFNPNAEALKELILT